MEVSDCPQAAGDRQISQPIGRPYSHMSEWSSPPWRSSHKVWRLSRYNFDWGQSGNLCGLRRSIEKRELYLLNLGTHTKRHLEDGSAGFDTKQGYRGRWGYDENWSSCPWYFEIPMEVCVLSHAMWICSIWSREKTGFWEVRHLLGLIFHIKILPRLTSSLFSPHTRELRSKTQTAIFKTKKFRSTIINQYVYHG